jgi:hypothetical protein
MLQEERVDRRRKRQSRVSLIALCLPDRVLCTAELAQDLLPVTPMLQVRVAPTVS